MTKEAYSFPVLRDGKKHKEIVRKIHELYVIIKEYVEIQYLICDIYSSIKCKIGCSEYYDITIVTHRPGLLIGKGGQDFDDLVKYLTAELDKPININLVESKLWAS